MSEEIDTEVQFWMLQASLALGRIDLEQMRQHINNTRSRRSQLHALGPILDPTAYRQSQADGTQRDAELQGVIAEALLKVREAIEAREINREKYLNKKDT